MKPTKRLFLSSPKILVVQRFMTEGAKVALAKEFQLSSPSQIKKWASPLMNKGAHTPNLLKRSFEGNAAFPEVDTDVTEFRAGDRKLYLSPVMDRFRRQAISDPIGTAPNLAPLITTSLRKTLSTFQDGEKPRVHPDQGPRYQYPHDRLPSVPNPEPHGCRAQYGRLWVGTTSAGPRVASDCLPCMSPTRPIRGLRGGAATPLAAAEVFGRFRKLRRAFASMTLENYTPTTRSGSCTPANAANRKRL